MRSPVTDLTKAYFSPCAMQKLILVLNHAIRQINVEMPKSMPFEKAIIFIKYEY